tara:strand:- start:2584 stop:3108 length:525 start_codon:yes stop_codon:yes gene_type:complete
MACDITDGRVLPCKDTVGGLKNVYFINYDTTHTFTEAADDTVAHSAFTGITAYQYALKGTSSLTQNITSSRENGTTFFEQVLELTLPKLSSADNKEIKLLAFGRPRIVIEDYNGNYFLVGREHGSDVTGGTIVTGAAMGDLSGYTLTFTGMEKKPSNFITGDWISEATIDDGSS